MMVSVHYEHASRRDIAVAQCNITSRGPDLVSAQSAYDAKIANVAPTNCSDQLRRGETNSGSDLHSEFCRKRIIRGNDT